MSEKVLKREERASLALRSLYRQYGYLPYKMSKFEEYDLYVANKEFLVGEGIVTFNDTDGRLLALKPDVTLSIIKNDLDGEDKRKVYYDENVYRISPKTKQFKEIKQVGLECLGEIDLYDVYETVCLAAESLAQISENFVLNVSHLGLLSAILSETGGGESFARKFTRAIVEKNAHEGSLLCEEYSLSESEKNRALALITTYGDRERVLQKIAPLCVDARSSAAFSSLAALCSLLKESKHADKIRLDFSVGGDMNYYDDILFKGFIEGVGEGVLSGGRCDKLLSRMGRSSGAIGFAVYLDLLEGLGESKRARDVDVLVLYDEGTDRKKLVDEVEKLVREGKTVRAQKGRSGLRYAELLDLSGGEK